MICMNRFVVDPVIAGWSERPDPESRDSGFALRAPRNDVEGSRRRGAQQAFGGGAGFGGDLGAGEHAGDFLAAVIGGERVDAGGDTLALVERVL